MRFLNFYSCQRDALASLQGMAADMPECRASEINYTLQNGASIVYFGFGDPLKYRGLVFDSIAFARGVPESVREQLRPLERSPK